MNLPLIVMALHLPQTLHSTLSFLNRSLSGKASMEVAPAAGDEAGDSHLKTILEWIKTAECKRLAAITAITSTSSITPPI